MLALLFARIPASLREQAFKRILRFVSSTCLPSVTTDANSLCQAAASAAPDQAMRLLTIPLLQRLQQDLVANTQPSKVQCYIKAIVFNADMASSEILVAPVAEHKQHQVHARSRMHACSIDCQQRCGSSHDWGQLDV